MHDLVLTVIAEDKPGLVERIAQTISEHDGNWLDSRMARMAGQFAGILRVQVAQARQGELLAALTALQEQGLRIQLASAGSASASVCRAIRLELVGNDRPGIVRDITRLLSSHGVNVESLTTEVVPAPMSGELLFQAQALLAVPEGLALEQLQSHLETLADDLMVELKLQLQD